MRKIFLLMVAGLLMAGCCKTQNSVSDCTDRASVVDELMMSRRSIRQYKDSAISRDLLNEILLLGINAPNGRNQQAYEIRVADSREWISELTAAVVSEQPQLAERPGFKNIFVGAPCVVFIAADKNYDLSHVDCGLLGENIILAAWARGIGSCCLGAPVRMLRESKAAQPFMRELRFSEGYELLYCIALGYPAEQPDRKPRREEKVQFVR